MKLSIIIPVYNSSKILRMLIESIKKFTPYDIYSTEVILINDYSLDDSWNKIKILRNKFNFIKGINLKKNYGQHSAIFCGLKLCKGDYIICMDDDMQHHPMYLSKILQELKQYEVCYVKYLNREHSFIKIMISKLNNIISSYLMNKSYNLYTSSFKGLTKKLNKKIIKSDESFIFLDYLIFKNTNLITSVNVTHKKRLHGYTNYGFRQLLTLWSKMIFLIEPGKKDFRFYIVKLIRFFFKLFLKKYINLKSKEKIEILEII